jgi:hypothetical protein
MKIVIKILFTILLTISIFFYTFQLQIFSMTEQDLFYLLALQRVEVGDIMAKSLTHGSRSSFKTKSTQLGH